MVSWRRRQRAHEGVVIKRCRHCKGKKKISGMLCQACKGSGRARIMVGKVR